MALRRRRSRRGGSDSRSLSRSVSTAANRRTPSSAGPSVRMSAAWSSRQREHLRVHLEGLEARAMPRPSLTRAASLSPPASVRLPGPPQRHRLAALVLRVSADLERACRTARAPLRGRPRPARARPERARTRPRAPGARSRGQWTGTARNTGGALASSDTYTQISPRCERPIASPIRSPISRKMPQGLLLVRARPLRIALVQADAGRAWTAWPRCRRGSPRPRRNARQASSIRRASA